jgi:energy-converting hydrogenase Eha subunit B
LRSQYPQALSTTLKRNTQPFDAPDNASLSVYLHATQTAVNGPSRVQLQVGLKATERRGGIRPAMNVAVVLDLPEMVEVAVAQQARALLMALNQQRQTGDRFSVTVAGVPGGNVVLPGDFRHGTVVSFIERLAIGKLEGETIDLVDAFVLAVDRLAADDDPTAVLGSSLVMLVTAGDIDAQTRDSLEILAHRSAVAGMPVSLVTLAGAEGSDLDSIALAGQGRLRALAVPADAEQLIDGELHSASRTVARAVRLRIHLAPGVRLVDVIGSHRLDEVSAERVREAERSIDSRLSRTWGIEADRGEDEDGIQIVIPSIAAGENHVVLLDLVVNGPGDVADVRVRYKDLVQMSNGVTRISLSLADANATRQVQGPLERNVLKNLVAFETAEAVRRGGRHLANGDRAAARSELMDALALITGLRQSVAGWQNDAELQADEQRLARFVSELDAGQTDMLVAALEYAAYRKLLPAAMNED